MRSPRTATKSSSGSPQLEKARAQQQRPNAAKNKSINKFILKKTKTLCFLLGVSQFYIQVLFCTHGYPIVPTSFVGKTVSLILSAGSFPTLSQFPHIHASVFNTSVLSERTRILFFFLVTRLFFFLFFFNFLFYIGGQLINNVVLVSGVQQSDSVIHMHVSIVFQTVVT